MRTTSLMLASMIVLGPVSARAETPVTVTQRGFLTHLGMGLLIGGMAGLGLGVAGAIGSSDANTRLAAYGPQPTMAERPSVEALQSRLFVNSVLAGVGLVAGALATAFGIGFIVGDAPRGSVAFVPVSQGGVFVLSGGF